LPQAAFFPAPAPVRLGGADSELHLPALATQRADRAPLTDPAGGAAWNAVVGLGLPARLQAAAGVLEPLRQAARRRAAGRLSQVLAESNEAVAASSAPYARLDK